MLRTIASEFGRRHLRADRRARAVVVVPVLPLSQLAWAAVGAVRTEYRLEAV